MLNEIVMYILCLLSVYFCSVESPIESRLAIGWVLITIFMVQMLGNTLFLLKLMFKHIKLVCKRKWVHKRRERTAGQVLNTMKLINMQLFSNPLNNSLEEPKNSPPSSESAPAAINTQSQSKEVESNKNLGVPVTRRPKTDGLLSLSDIK